MIFILTHMNSMCVIYDNVLLGALSFAILRVHQHQVYQNLSLFSCVSLSQIPQNFTQNIFHSSKKNALKA